jgi:hypothetical protein
VQSINCNRISESVLPTARTRRYTAPHLLDAEGAVNLQDHSVSACQRVGRVADLQAVACPDGPAEGHSQLGADGDLH